MKIITKTLLLTIIIIFFPLKSFGHVEHYEKVEKFLMEIFKDGKKIGFNNYTFNKNKENLVIENKTEFNVSILGLNAFSIKGSSKEVYKNNKLVSFKSDTIQNKKKKFVDLYLDESNESYFIKGSSYTGKVDLDIVIGSNIHIGGTVTGNIKSRNQVTLKKSCILKGDISYRKLHIEDGAQFEGKCDLLSD